MRLIFRIIGAVAVLSGLLTIATAPVRAVSLAVLGMAMFGSVRISGQPVAALAAVAATLVMISLLAGPFRVVDFDVVHAVP